MSDGSETMKPDFISAEVDAERYRPARSRALVRGAVVIAIIMVIAVAVPAVMIQVQKSNLENDLERRLEILSRGRAEVIDTWLDGMTRPADRVVDSELFRLFATEMDLSGGDISDLATGGESTSENAEIPTGLGVPLAAQLPFMSQVLGDFVENAGFLDGYLVNRDGIAYVTSPGAETIDPGQQAIAKTVFETGRLTYGALRSDAAGLVIDFYAPVSAAQSESPLGQTVGVLLLTAPVAERLSQVLTPPPLAEPGERLKLVQRSEGGLVWVAPGGAPPLAPIENLTGGLAAPGTGGAIAFAERSAIGGSTAVYSVGSAVAGPAWWVVQEIDAQAARAKLGGFITAVSVVAALVVITVIAAFGAFWWRLSNEHNSALAEQFRRLAARIEAQKKLLDSINNSIADYIGLKSKDGVYRYLNPAFARAIGREVEEAVGLDDAAIFGRGTADRLEPSDRRALESGGAVTVNEEIYLGSRLHHLQISKVPYQDETGEVSGIVSVIRDVTELVEEQNKRERAVLQMVAALVRAVELRDPYLAGHSRRLTGFAVAVAQRLEAGPEEIATVEIAANLSQIGKLAVPREILTKPGRLTEAEIVQMQQHIDHVTMILRDIDFELPVLETITEMHERLDGKGYPKGLTSGQISRAALILGACDVFCARLAPRSYRGGIAPEVALDILDQNLERYDAAVVAALRGVVGSVAGEKLIAGLDTG
jgi:PAS domain S-box-containing protein